MFLLSWFHVPDPKPANTFFMRSVCVCLDRDGCERKNWIVCVCVIVNMCISLSKRENTEHVFAKSLNVQPIIPITPFLVLSLVCISDEGWGEKTGELLLLAKCHDKLIFSLKSQTMDKT